MLKMRFQKPNLSLEDHALLEFFMLFLSSLPLILVWSFVRVSLSSWFPQASPSLLCTVKLGSNMAVFPLLPVLCRNSALCLMLDINLHLLPGAHRVSMFWQLITAIYVTSCCQKSLKMQDIVAVGQSQWHVTMAVGHDVHVAFCSH